MIFSPVANFGHHPLEILMATLQTLASRLFISIFWLTVIPITIWILDYFLAFYIQQLQFFGH